MTLSMDRRSVLTSLGALGVAGCGMLPFKKGGALDLSALEARHGGRLGLAAMNQTSTVFWRAEERFIYCSTFKLFLATAVLEKAAGGQERLDREIPILAQDMIPHAPVTENAVGKSMTVEALCQAAVEQSDNPAANILIRELGGLVAFREWYASIGDTVTRVDRLEPDLNVKTGDLDTTTPAQAVTNIDGRLMYGSSLTSEVVPRLVNWMLTSPTGPGRLKAGVPEGWRVAHKTGTGGSGPTNDIGLLYSADGKTTVPIAVYYEATPTSTPAQRDAVIADATRIALKALGHD